MAYHRGSTLVAQREYTYDILGRPTSRNTARQGSVVSDTFTHNTRSELAAATVNGKDYAYLYDNIGNRKSAVEGEDSTVYTSNALNQYTSIQENTDEAFQPEFDADGNQTRVKTSTGIWALTYDTENRPTEFTSSTAEGSTIIQCAYDTMGRRAFKKVITNGAVTLHQRYIYRGYLQIACIDLTRSHHPALWLITWDPSQTVATRPLAIQKNGTWYTYGLDLTKNVCEVFGSSGYIGTAYTYTPFGEVTASGNVDQPIQWSSEYYDVESALSSYTKRNYVSNYANWLSRDIISEKISHHLYKYCGNRIFECDYLGAAPIIVIIDSRNNMESYIRQEYAKVNELMRFALNTLKRTPLSRFEELKKEGKILWNSHEYTDKKEKLISLIEREMNYINCIKRIYNESTYEIMLQMQEISIVEATETHDSICLLVHGANSNYCAIPIIPNDAPMSYPHAYIVSEFWKNTKDSPAQKIYMSCYYNLPVEITPRLNVRIEIEGTSQCLRKFDITPITVDYYHYQYTLDYDYMKKILG